ncbi:restriction endonuclease subunit S [Chryseobacterium flavum]|uniref:restriction endonuclease subunit S n=1 Tax=Chryseobacterium flavum TaxID=415851 RepID=UPI0028A6441B|nr:restriction endonuclease subunit S [Chryseobacterium flavum]
MSTLKELLKDIPVEWKSLGEVCNILNGYAFESKRFNNEGIGIPLIRIRDINTGFSNTYYTGNYDSRFVVENGDILIGMDGDFRAVKWQHDKALLNQRVCRLQDFKEDVYPDFIFYIIYNELNRIHTKIEGTTVKHLSSKELSKSIIPIPPIDIQKNIAHTLEGLSEHNTALITALEEEISSRKKQYKYYREQLFQFDGKKVEWKKINEIGTFQRGKRFVRTDMLPEGIPCIHYGEMYTHYGTWANKAKSYLNKDLVQRKKLRVADKGDVIIVAAGETIEDIGKGTAWLGEEGIVIHDACFSYKSPLNSKYLAYFTRTIQFHDQIKRNISSGKISAINEKGFNKVIIPVPLPQEQERIVNLLDEYNIATQAILKELQNEIELRNKQYEYYRNLLLTFPKEN